MKPSVLLRTCEHGGNRVPSAYRSVFRGARSALDSHRGQDMGALALARVTRCALVVLSNPYL